MIDYDKEKQLFTLRTADTCYAFKVAHGKYLCHVYYGPADRNFDWERMPEKTSFATAPKELERTGFSLETMPSEYAFYGTGDFRSASLRLVGADGDASTMFHYEGFRVFEGCEPLDGLPFARGESVPALEISLRDEVTRCRLILGYKVFYDSNVVTRYVRVVNEGGRPVAVESCMSLCLDLFGSDYDVLSLYGSYGNEMQLKRNPLFFGSQRLVSRRGATGHKYNPFFAVCAKNADYDRGEIYGFNLIYSGGFLSEAEVCAHSPVGAPYDTVRIQTGVCPENFGYVLPAGERFTSPEAVMTFSAEGINGLTRYMHRFVNGHILPDPGRTKPIALNTWEACYFGIDEKKLLAFAEICPRLGIDTLVVDDGWFGRRDDDTSSLGDWTADKRKFGSGLKAFAEKVSRYVRFGIWVEPEMISEDSELYRRRPDWVLGRTKRPLSTGRRQYVLDLTNPEVVEYLKETFKRTFDGVPVRYIKWDMNRHLTEAGTRVHPSDGGGAVAYRYTLAVYELLGWFRKTFPGAFIETCSGGGGRYDLGLACYSDMIWASDNTYPEKRLLVQSGALTAYPAGMMSCHVSNPGGICERPDELELRFVTAAQGMLGYELDLTRVSDGMAAAIAAQISRYAVFRDVVAHGTYAVIRPPQADGTGVFAFYGERAIVLLAVAAGKSTALKPARLKADETAVYAEYFTGERVTGAMLAGGYAIESPENGRLAVLKYFVKQGGQSK